jgi:hypothetical protein
MASKPDIEAAIEAMKAATRGRRSPAHEWMAAHYDRLETAFRTAQPSWNALADYLGKSGVMGSKGKPVTAGAIRQTWLRVRSEKIGQQGQSRQPDPSLPNPVRAAALPDATAPADYDDFDFNKFVREKQ